MSPDSPKMQSVLAKPAFNDARGAAIVTSVPPYDFQGAVIRVFPLRAQPNTLRKFCDQFLNLAPPEVAEFRPAMPYVLLMIVNYGRMAPEVANVGWVAQNEVVFSVPVEWHRKVDGKYEFQDFATVSPYIYVDSDPSQTTGREVYGWQKVRAWMSPGLDTWTRSPLEARKLLELSTLSYEAVYSGRRRSVTRLLEILHDPPVRFTRIPPDVQSPLNPWIAGATAITNGLSLIQQMADAMSGLRLRGFNRELADLPRRMSRVFGFMNPLSETPWFNTVNLKQFRDAEHPELACYQALVNSRMKILRFNTGGMLGDNSLLRGDVSGGFKIRLHRLPTAPIVETLGLETEAEEEGDGVPVAVLRPEFPCWSDVDLRYDAGERIAWRTRSSRWFTDSEAARLGDDDSSGFQMAGWEAGNAYNTSLGPPLISTAGPFHFPGVTVRVLPLLADHDKLQAFCEAYLDANAPAGQAYRFEAFGRYVYLLVFSFDTMWSETDDVGQWAHRAVRFSFPIRWCDSSGSPMSLGLLSPYAYADSEVGTHTGREVFGLPTVHAEIDSPETPWLTSTGLESNVEQLLSLETEVLAGFFTGQEMQERTLLEIYSGAPLPENETMEWLEVARHWGHTLKQELERKTDLRRRYGRYHNALRAMALELLANGKPLNEIALKQFRAVGNPKDDACYQAIVRSTGILENLHDLREIERPLHLKIHRYASQPIVDTLGLEVKLTETTEDGVVHTLEPIRPFWIKADLRIDRTDNLWERTMGGVALQQAVKLLPPTYFQNQGRSIEVGRHLVREIDDQRDHRPPFWSRRAKKQNLAVWSREWQREAANGEIDGAEARKIGLDEALRAIEVLEPQMAIESILSHEWGNWGTPRWYRREVLGQRDVREKPEFCVRRDSVGSSRDEVFPLAPGDLAYRLEDDDRSGWYPGEKPLPETEDEDVP